MSKKHRNKGKIIIKKIFLVSGKPWNNLYNCKKYCTETVLQRVAGSPLNWWAHALPCLVPAAYGDRAPWGSHLLGTPTHAPARSKPWVGGCFAPGFRGRTGAPPLGDGLRSEQARHSSEMWQSPTLGISQRDRFPSARPEAVSSVHTV